MRVGLNATCFNDRPSGARQRFCGIYGELIRRCRDTEFVVYEPADCRVAEWFVGAPNVTARRTPIPSSGRLRRALRGLGYWRKALAADRLDLFEAFNLPLVKAPHCPTLLTLHDLRPVRRDVPPVARLGYAAILRHALAQAAHVIAVSHTVEREILEFRPGTPVSTIYNGVDIAALRAAPTGGSDLARWALIERFVLSIGHLEPRKNHLALIDAIGRLRDQGLRVPLVIAGNDAGQGAAIREAIRRLDLADRIEIVEGATDEQLRLLYRRSAFVVFPSLYEGFGIPILEAMALARAVLLSDLPVFREITEDRGIYFPPADSAAMAAAIATLWTDPAACDRLVDYGDERVTAFGFLALAGELEQLYGRFTAPARRP